MTDDVSSNGDPAEVKRYSEQSPAEADSTAVDAMLGTIGNARNRLSTERTAEELSDLEGSNVNSLNILDHLPFVPSKTRISANLKGIHSSSQILPPTTNHSVLMRALLNAPASLFDGNTSGTTRRGEGHDPTPKIKEEPGQEKSSDDDSEDDDDDGGGGRANQTVSVFEQHVNTAVGCSQTDLTTLTDATGIGRKLPDVLLPQIYPIALPSADFPATSQLAAMFVNQALLNSALSLSTSSADALNVTNVPTCVPTSQLSPVSFQDTLSALSANSFFATQPTVPASTAVNSYTSPLNVSTLPQPMPSFTPNVVFPGMAHVMSQAMSQAAMVQGNLVSQVSGLGGVDTIVPLLNSSSSSGPDDNETSVIVQDGGATTSDGGVMQLSNETDTSHHGNVHESHTP